MNVIRIDPNILAGTPCFAGTRVPVDTLFDHLRGGYTVAYFLTQFPSVTKEQVDAVLVEAIDRLELSQRYQRAAG